MCYNMNTFCNIYSTYMYFSLISYKLFNRFPNFMFFMIVIITNLNIVINILIRITIFNLLKVYLNIFMLSII